MPLEADTRPIPLSSVLVQRPPLPVSIPHSESYCYVTRFRSYTQNSAACRPCSSPTASSGPAYRATGRCGGLQTRCHTDANVSDSFGRFLLRPAIVAMLVCLTGRVGTWSAFPSRSARREDCFRVGTVRIQVPVTRRIRTGHLLRRVRPVGGWLWQFPSTFFAVRDGHLSPPFCCSPVKATRLPLSGPSHLLITKRARLDTRENR